MALQHQLCWQMVGFGFAIHLRLLHLASPSQHGALRLQASPTSQCHPHEHLLAMVSWWLASAHHLGIG